MSSKQQPVPKKTLMDIVIWVVTLGLIGAGIWANDYYNYIDVSLRLIGWLVLIIVAAVLALQSHQGKAILHFVRASRTELRRVVWPTRQETVQTTLIVLGAVILLGLIIWGIDTILLHVMGWLTGQRG